MKLKKITICIIVSVLTIMGILGISSCINDNESNCQNEASSRLDIEDNVTIEVDKTSEENQESENILIKEDCVQIDLIEDDSRNVSDGFDIVYPKDDKKDLIDKDNRVNGNETERVEISNRPTNSSEVDKSEVEQEDKEEAMTPMLTPTPSKPVVTPTPSKPAPTPTPTPSKPVHTHTWVDVTETVHHPAETKTETRVIEEAWTEEVPIYEKYYVEICNGCGMDITNNRGHLKEQALAGNYACGSSRTEPRKKQVGTDIIEHPAVTEEVTVVVREAWTETVVVGQKCSGCGSTK